MKAIQVTFDEGLLAELDADEEVKREGRSAVLRKAAFDYLRTKKREEIANAYARGYRAGAADLEGWAGTGVWPEE